MSMVEIRLFGIKKGISEFDDEPWQKLYFHSIHFANLIHLVDMNGFLGAL